MNLTNKKSHLFEVFVVIKTVGRKPHGRKTRKGLTQAAKAALEYGKNEL